MRIEWNYYFWLFPRRAIRNLAFNAVFLYRDRDWSVPRGLMSHLGLFPKVVMHERNGNIEVWSLNVG
jgi:hypothetical protein